MIRLVRLNEVQYVETEIASKRLQAEGFVVTPLSIDESEHKRLDEVKQPGRKKVKSDE